KLSRDATSLYWIQGDIPVSGILDGRSHDHAAMRSTSSETIRPPSPKGNVPGCTIVRADALDATLGGDPVTTFSGSLAYTFSATADSDCTDQLAASGGGYETLPCTVNYTLVGNLMMDGGAK